MKKTLIAIPCMDQVPTQFCQSLATLEKPGPTVVAFQIGSLIYTSRNQLAAEAIRQGADYIFWLDSDMMFVPQTLKYMMQVLEQQDEETILSGLYFRRVAPFSPVAFDKIDLSGTKAEWSNIEEVPDGLFEVEGIGFGCVLMPTQAVLDVQGRFGDMFTPILGCGEDLSFSWRARQCGWKLLIDPRFELGHVGHHIITRDFWEDYRAFGAQEGKKDE